MASEPSSYKGRLIALEGSRGLDLAPAAKRLLGQVRHGKEAGGYSLWDASAIFFELRKGDKGIPPPSPRTLILLYAADLAFRLRWEIAPALEEGMVVVAAPYVESAIAFGVAAGLARQWLSDLLEFAPAAAATYRLKEKKENSNWKFKKSEGFLEFCCKTLLSASPSTSPVWNPLELRQKFIAQLEALERRGGCQLADYKPAR